MHLIVKSRVKIRSQTSGGIEIVGLGRILGDLICAQQEGRLRFLDKLGEMAHENGKNAIIAGETQGH